MHLVTVLHEEQQVVLFVARCAARRHEEELHSRTAALLQSWAAGMSSGCAPVRLFVDVAAEAWVAYCLYVTISSLPATTLTLSSAMLQTTLLQRVTNAAAGSDAGHIMSPARRTPAASVPAATARRRSC